MDDDFIVAVYVVIDETMRVLAHRDHPLAGVSDAEVLTVAVVAARFVQSHLARALQVIPVAGTFAGLALALNGLVTALVAPLLFQLF